MTSSRSCRAGQEQQWCPAKEHRDVLYLKNAGCLIWLLNPVFLVFKQIKAAGDPNTWHGHSFPQHSPSRALGSHGGVEPQLRDPSFHSPFARFGGDRAERGACPEVPGRGRGRGRCGRGLGQWGRGRGRGVAGGAARCCGGRGGAVAGSAGTGALGPVVSAPTGAVGSPWFRQDR